MAEKQTETKETKSTYELAEVATQTSVMIREITTGKILTESEALAQILNDIQIIKRSVA